MAVVRKGKQLEVVDFLLTDHGTGFPEDTGDNTGHLGQQGDYWGSRQLVYNCHCLLVGCS